MKFYKFKSQAALHEFGDNFSSNSVFVEWFTRNFNWDREFCITIDDCRRILISIPNSTIEIPDRFQDLLTEGEIEDYLEEVDLIKPTNYKLKIKKEYVVELDGHYSVQDLKFIIKDMEDLNNGL